jgi:diguanylate cyclase (GGDEF)-like protein
MNPTGHGTPLQTRPVVNWRQTPWSRLLLPMWTALAVIAVLTWARPASVARLDLLAYDMMLPSHPRAADVAVVLAIDDESLARIGRWPWPRAVHAQLLDKLAQAGVPVVGFTVLFSEPEEGSGAGDSALAQAMRRQGGVVLPLAPLQQVDGTIVNDLPTPVLRAASARLGHVDAEIDLDGQVRRIYLQAGAGAAQYPAFALALLQQYRPQAVPAELSGLRAVSGAPSTGSAMRWLRDFEVLLPRTDRAEPISIARLLDTPDLMQQLRGRMVIVGVSASGLGGELASPLAGARSNMPAAQLHAQAFDALRAGTLISPASPGACMVFGFALGCGPLLWPVAGRRRLHPWWMTGTVVAPVAACAVLLYGLQIWFAPFASTLGLVAAAGVWLGVHMRESSRSLIRTQQHAKAMLEAIGDGVIAVNMHSSVVYANPVALDKMGAGELLGKPLASALRLDIESLAMLGAAVDECLHRARDVRPEHLLCLPFDGDANRSLRASVSPLRDPDNRLEGAVIVMSDVTDTVASANRLRHAATHDALTGLPNRTMLHERLSLALARTQRISSTIAILFLDLDRFKRINDSLGHSHGDEVLKETARRLSAICRSTDFVVRWGGDEFVVVMEDVSGPEAVAATASKLIAALGEDVDIHGVRVTSNCSVGIALAPQDGIDIDGLLAKADTAMYRAKSHPDAGFHFYSSDLKVWTRERLALEVELRHALREDQFELHYQPQFRLSDGALVGFEALLRWRREPDTLVPPAEFIGVAEESGLIVEIGAWVVSRTTADIAQWIADGLQAMPVAVNVSARQCVNRNIVEVVRSALEESRIPPALLKLELTETTAMTDAARVIELLGEISAMGVRISVDDFGTGYSSLAYLKRFPISELKIDRSFVQDVTTDVDDAAIVRATIVLAHELGIQVVAEGVENDAQMAFLLAQSCDIVQGFLCGRPQPLSATTPLL